MSDELPRWMVRIKNAFSPSVDDTARAVARFAATKKKKLYYPWQAVPLFLTMMAGQSLIPGFFQGRKTRDGRARRVPPNGAPWKR